MNWEYIEDSKNRRERKRRDKSGDGGERTDQLKVFFLFKQTEREKKKRKEEKKNERDVCPGAAAGRTDLMCTGSRKLFAGAPLPSKAYKWGMYWRVEQG